jgi:hypothetical protein
MLYPVSGLPAGRDYLLLPPLELDPELPDDLLPLLLLPEDLLYDEEELLPEDLGE